MKDNESSLYPCTEDAGGGKIKVIEIDCPKCGKKNLNPYTTLDRKDGDKYYPPLRLIAGDKEFECCDKSFCQ